MFDVQIKGTGRRLGSIPRGELYSKAQETTFKVLERKYRLRPERYGPLTAATSAALG